MVSRVSDPLPGARSADLYRRAQSLIPGGVNSPVRAFRAVGGEPIFLERGQGSRIYDVDGHDYIDYVGSWGPLILGHAHPAVIEAVTRAAERGTSFGASTEAEVELAQLIVDAVPSIEMVRLVNSGTEAAMSAIRLARAYTGRTKIVKFDGCYHGHADGLLVKAGSGALTLGVPDSAGVPPSVAGETISARYNDLSSVESAFERYGEDVAAVIVEPVAGNMGVVPPEPGFLDGLRALTTRTGALLIFDEVITGFRIHYGGAQTLYGIEPDLTCLGKIIGGGLPVGAYGGRRVIMEGVAPLGAMYQAGTLSGNPLAVAAGIATLSALRAPGVYQQLESRSAQLESGLSQAIRTADLPGYSTRVGSMMTFFFTSTAVHDYESARTGDTTLYAHFFRGLLDSGVYFAPSQFEATFVSLAHSESDIDATIESAGGALKTLTAQ